MASGFSGGGADFYPGVAGRSISTMNTNNPSHPSYRTQLSQIFLDQSSQIAQHRAATTNLASPSLIGKRTLADFQAHQQHKNLNSALNGLLLRSVKPRMYQHTSPISTLSPIEFSANMSPELPSLLSQRYGVPLHQQLRPHPINLGPGLAIHATNQTLPGATYTNALQNQNRGRAVGQDSEKKMMDRLQELEKQLLDDNDDEEGDAVSVITNTNSEWSETIQNLIRSSSPNPISPSPSSSSSSSSSSSTSVTTPIPNCSKQTVLDAASAIYEGKTDVATEILTRVSQPSYTKGNSEQRLVEYMVMALKSRVNSAESPPPVVELYSKEHVRSTHLLYELSPCFRLGFMAVNFAILEATLDQPNSSNGFHIIDFDIGQGIQYMNLLHLLSERQNVRAIVKITAVADNCGEEKERLRVVGDKLSQRAERVGVSLHFHVVTCKLGDLSRDSLGCEPDEALVVNFAYKLYRMPDESVSTENPRDELLRRVKGLAPRVVTLLEREVNTNTAPFMARVNELCSYYGALFDSIDSTVQRDTAERVKMEDALRRKVANSVACEGRDRVERCEVFGKWRARMGMAGFELKPLKQNVAESIKARLTPANRVKQSITIKEENGGVSFGWMGKTLTVASAWR